MRVLVVEDQKNVARFIAKGLREQAYAVDVAEDGAEGLAMTEIARYDVIVLDLMLPKVDGFEVCRRLRERGVETPILMLTARDDKRSRIEGLDSLVARYGPYVVSVELLAVGTPRRDWRSTLLSDGWVIVRHPDLETTLEIADAVGTELQLYAE